MANMHLISYLIIILFKTPMRYPFIPNRIVILKGQMNTIFGNNVEKMKPSYIAENVKWCSHCVPKKFKQQFI